MEFLGVALVAAVFGALSALALAAGGGLVYLTWNYGLVPVLAVHGATYPQSVLLWLGIALLAATFRAKCRVERVS